MTHDEIRDEAASVIALYLRNEASFVDGVAAECVQEIILELAENIEGGAWREAWPEWVRL